MKNLNEKSNILYVLENFFPKVGGVETLFAYEVAEKLRIGANVWVLTTKTNKYSAKDREGEFLKYIEETNKTKQNLEKLPKVDNFKIVEVGTTSRFGYTLLGIPKIIRLCKQQSFDIVHTTSYNAAMVGVFAKIYSKNPHQQFIITFHEFWGDLWFKLPFLNIFQRLAYRIFEKIISKLPYTKIFAVSNYTRERLTKSGISPEKVETKYNKVDIDYLKSLKANYGQNYRPKTKKQILEILENPEKGLNLAFLGRASFAKGLEKAVLAKDFFSTSVEKKSTISIKSTNSTIPEPKPNKLTVYTPEQNPILTKIQQKSKKIGTNSQITYKIGYKYSQIVKELYQAPIDAVIIPSHAEGFCFVAVEMLNLGIPIIHSGNGALLEVTKGEEIRISGLNNAELGQKENKKEKWWFASKPPLIK